MAPLHSVYMLNSDAHTRRCLRTTCPLEAFTSPRWVAKKRKRKCSAESLLCYKAYPVTSLFTIVFASSPTFPFLKFTINEVMISFRRDDKRCRGGAAGRDGATLHRGAADLAFAASLP